ncbi:hypothetical protein Lsed01_02445 [Demequina sediminis]|uniref:DUF7507 domain-containing protein n=1 Tax=Demequina sediminis TaxID=1930058 RepID=A0ABP9WJG4_9MICO|nr:hypothetical protein [Demequina sediminis]BDZ62963.1 hypothetical protein GCM10025873_27540 [Demequina sediminis]
MLARITSAVAASLVAATLVATPAGAVPRPSLLDEAQALAAEARTAVDAVNAAYVARDVDVLLARAAEVDAADAALEDLLAQAQAAVADADAAADNARDVVEAAEVDVDQYALLDAEVVAAQTEYDDAVAALAAIDVTIASLGAQLAATPATIAGPPMCFPDAVVGTICLPGMSMPNPTYTSLQIQVGTAQANRVSAQATLTTASDTLGDAIAARDVYAGAADALAVAIVTRDSVVIVAAAAADERDEITNLHHEVHWLAGEVADRRLDAADLVAFEESAGWTFGEPSEASAGDTVRLEFSLVNTAAFQLFDATVAVVEPAGLDATCDITDGTIAAGEAVSCTVDYTVTSADAARGSVDITVELTGFLPIGPGNPRAAAVANGTEVTVAQTFSFDVAAAAVVDEEEDVVTDTAPVRDRDATVADELSDTGAESLPLLVVSASLIAAGALLVSRRRARA